MTRSPILLLSEYNVTQNIIEALTNVCYRAILFSIRDGAKDAGRIATDLDISLSTVYAALRRLEDLALVEKRYKLTGKTKIKMYQSRISRAEIVMDGSEPELRLFRTEK